MLRRLLHASYEIQERVHSHEALAARARRPGRARDPRGRPRGRRKDFRVIDDVLDAELDKLEKLSREGTAITGTPSGFEDLDAITGGFQPGNLIILAARPSMGKSALMANFAENAALGLRQGRRAVLARDVRGRARPALHRLAGVDQGRRPAQGQASRRRAGAKILAAPPTRLARVAAVHRRLVATCRCSTCAPRPAGSPSRTPDGLGLIVIDYLQLMRAGGARRQPRRADRPDLPRPQDARARARGAR